MAKKQDSDDAAEDLRDRADQASRSLAERGRAVMDQAPAVMDGVGAVLGTASSQVDDLSDQGVLTALALSSGVLLGLFLAGAPRPILALGLLPIAITARAAMHRGVRVSRLLN